MWPKIKLIQTVMDVLVTCKNEEDPFKNEGTQQISNCKSVQIFYDAQGKLTTQSEVGSKFKLIQAFMVVLVTCKNEEDPIKNEGARMVITMLHYPSIYKMLNGS